MQTFLPYPSYIESMRCLDKARLGNQVYREGITLLRGKWANHPASKMWRGHEYDLGKYLLAGLRALSERGRDYPHHVEEINMHMDRFRDTGPPLWLGDPAFHASHRSNLLRKNPDWYGQFGWNEPHDLEYVWPSIRG